MIFNSLAEKFRTGLPFPFRYRKKKKNSRYFQNIFIMFKLFLITIFCRSEFFHSVAEKCVRQKSGYEVKRQLQCIVDFFLSIFSYLLWFDEHELS